DIEIMATLYQHIRKLYEEEGGTFADPIVNLDWPYVRPHYPTADELAKEINGRALEDLYDPNDPDRLIRKAGEQLSGFGEMRDDGTTLSGCWIYAGSWTEDGNNIDRKSTRLNSSHVSISYAVFCL